MEDLDTSPRDPQESPSDDPADWTVEPGDYTPVLTEPRWVVPSSGIPSDITPLASNNNLDIEFFEGRLYLAWRTGSLHFAGEDSRMEVVSSADGGETWEFETTFALGTDVREPRFYIWEDRLHFLFFEAGINPINFEPKTIWHTSRTADEPWKDLDPILGEEEVPWDIKNRNGALWLTSYVGDHYTFEEDGGIDVLFRTSTDGVHWTPVGETASVYYGGISEVAFEFAEDGTLWGVGRNEDGDKSGYGSNLCTAPAQALHDWTCTNPADPMRYDSPELFRHGSNLYMIARRNPDGPFGPDADFFEYSFSPKRTALYTIDQESKSVVHLMDIPGVGDTAFPSVRRVSAHEFLVGNYTSPLSNPDLSWAEAQVATEGTQIYLLDLLFEPSGSPE